ncbi:acyltransferase family protein [Altererythrobacter xixiisoli]|uniref:Acyltransferase family protein n=1 Tax=Croceibacterium xixiisoli TaxID=1476466 RepID=A0A6I4TVE5_9SPHN|nr:acyltransferase [Croceibacterium xixiisoli]MXO99782.1 acyltransferase family protein [Croceibacterium xixiisoli]
MTTPATPANSDRGSQFLSIQALRFIAALAVVVLHSTFYTMERLHSSTSVYDVGANGVRLFFVISGFVMIISSQKLLNTQRGWSVFAFKRIVRIVPIYWAITLIKVAVLLVTPAVVLHSELDWGYILKSFFFIPEYNVDGEIRPLLGVGWTLNFEMFFYLLFALALACRVRPIRFIAPVLIVMSALSLIKTPDWPVVAYFLCDPIVIDFLAGMLIAHWVQRGWTGPSQAAAWAAAGVGLIYLFVPGVPRAEYGTMFASLITTLAAGSVIIGAVGIEKSIGRRIPQWMVYMGAASYSLYLVHPMVSPAAPALFAKIGLTGGFMAWLAVVTAVAVAMGAAVLVYRYGEVPFTKWLNRRVRDAGLFDTGPRSRSLPATLAAPLRERSQSEE